jgi:general stress protein YciG
MTEKREIGFALMTVRRQREIASMGGRACPASARTFSDPQKASEAGRRGVEVKRAKAWAAKAHLLNMSAKHVEKTGES